MVLRLESAGLTVELLPQVGGKVSRVIWKAGERELLICPREPYVQIPVGADWVNYPIGGIDDCFPVIAPGLYPFKPWKGVGFQTLGEWAYGGWDVVSQSDNEVTMSRTGGVIPYTVLKRLSLEKEDRICFDYRVANQGRYPLKYLWALHPLFCVGNRFRLRLPEGIKRYRIYPGPVDFRDWPTYTSTDLSREWISHGRMLKIFLEGLQEGWCELELEEYAIRVSYNAKKQPLLGIWFNNFGFPQSGGKTFRCIALEPCTAASDQLDELNPELYPAIPPGETESWSVELCVSGLELRQQRC